MNGQQLKTEAREQIARIPREELREIIAKSRWSCASHWQMSVVMALGWEAANKLNLQVDQTVGNVEMKRLMKALRLEKPRDKDQFLRMMTLAMETFITKDYFDYEFIPGSDIGIIHSCYAYTKVHSLGLDKEYACGCFGLRQGWYQAMGLQVTEKLLKCLKDGDDRCEILLEKIAFSA